jgi:hypothetical protein
MPAGMGLAPRLSRQPIGKSINRSDGTKDNPFAPP